MKISQYLRVCFLIPRLSVLSRLLVSLRARLLNTNLRYMMVGEYMSGGSGVFIRCIGIISAHLETQLII